MSATGTARISGNDHLRFPAISFPPAVFDRPSSSYAISWTLSPGMSPGFARARVRPFRVARPPAGGPPRLSSGGGLLLRLDAAAQRVHQIDDLRRLAQLLPLDRLARLLPADQLLGRVLVVVLELVGLEMAGLGL